MISEKYKGVTIEGSHFPDKPITDNVKITLSPSIISKYIPASLSVDMTKGSRLLGTIMANKEGFFEMMKSTGKPSRSYATNNPGNIGNTDSGANKKLASLEDGIEAQRDYFIRIIEGKHKSFPMNKQVIIKPFYSEEIARNQKLYGMSPYLPGYKFVFTGQLDQFVKIYSTGARAGNSYLSMIISYFKNHGITITSKTTLQEIININ